MENIVVSIVMPHYNRVATVGFSIESVRQQTFSQWELIIIDDASDDVDQLEALLAKLGDSRIKLLRHEQNLNGAQARNTGINSARGELLAFLDSDDIWKPDKLELQLSALPEITEKTIIYTKLCCYNSEKPELKKLLPQRNIYSDELLGDYLFVSDGLMQTSSLLMKTEFAKQIEFNSTLRRHQDYDFLLRAESMGAKFIFLDQVLVDYIWLGNEKISTKSISVERSLYWLKHYKKYLSVEAEIGFLRKEVMKSAIRTGQIIPLLSYVRRSRGVGSCISFGFEILLTFSRLVKSKIWR